MAKVTTVTALLFNVTKELQFLSRQLSCDLLFVSIACYSELPTRDGMSTFRLGGVGLMAGEKRNPMRPPRHPLRPSSGQGGIPSSHWRATGARMPCHTSPTGGNAGRF